MDINTIGSISSVVALIAMAIGATYSIIIKFKGYINKRDKDSQDFKDGLVWLINDSTTSIERANVSTFIQHILSSSRHLVVDAYLSLIVFLVVYGVGIIAFILLDMLILSSILFFTSVIQLCVFAWFIGSIKNDIRLSDRDIRNAWGEHVEKSSSKNKKS